MVGASRALFASLALSMGTAANAYWLMGASFITTERLDPIVAPGTVSGHVHSVVGGSNFGPISSTDSLRGSSCTSVPIKEDKSNYWFPHLYFQWANGSFSSVNGGAVIYYLFPDKAGTTTAFPPNFRMLSGNPTKRSYDENSPAAKAIDFLCLDFNGKTTKHTGLPEKVCPSGIRSQVNFPSCWNGKDLDSPDHKSHVAFRSGGPDSGDCKDPNFPISLPRIFLEVYWGTGEFDKVRSQAMKPEQPFVFAYGDRTGFGDHADFLNGWDDGILQGAIDGCNCNMYGDPQCCADKGLFTLIKDPKCKINKQVDEVVTGMLPKLPGNNPVQEGPGDAKMMKADCIPAILGRDGQVAIPAKCGNGGSPAPAPPASSPVVVPSSSAEVPVPSPSAPAPSSVPAPPAPAPSSPPSSEVPAPPAPSSSPSGEAPAPAPSSSPSGEAPAPTPAPSSSPSGEVPAPPAPSSSPSGEVPAPVPTDANPGYPGGTDSPSPAPSPSSIDAPAPVPSTPGSDVPYPPTPSDPVEAPAPPADTPSVPSSSLPAPAPPVITLTPAPSPAQPDGKPPAKTYTSSRLIKPTSACIKKPGKNHAHHHYRRSTSPLRRQHHNAF